MIERQLSLLAGPRQRGVTVRSQASEYALHVSIADVLRVSLNKGWWWSHIGHGEERSHLAGARLKRMGLKPGIYDLLFFDPNGRPYFLELKTRDGRLSVAQVAFADAMATRGVICGVAFSFDEAMQILRFWGAVRVAI